MTEAWFMLAFFATAAPMESASILPWPPAQAGSAVATSTRDAFATERDCLDAVPAQADKIKKANSARVIPEGALGFVCVRGVRR